MNIKECIDLNKADLHVHLNGLFDTETIRKVIENENIEIPRGFNLDKDLNVLTYKKSLLNYLKPWNILRLIPTRQENLSILIRSAFLKLKQDNIKFIELRSSVIYLSLLFQKNLEDSLAILIDELTKASQTFEIPYGLILTIPRGEYSLCNLSQLLRVYTNLGKPSEIVGLDLAGNEDVKVTSDLALKFKIAKNERVPFSDKASSANRACTQ
jgi:adenosine deaminase